MTQKASGTIPTVFASVIAFSTCTLFASDVDATIRFYKNWFDAEVAWGGEVAGARNVFTRIGVGVLHLHDPPPRGDGKNAVRQPGMQVVGMDEIHERMKAAGLHVPNPIRRFDAGAATSIEPACARSGLRRLRRGSHDRAQNPLSFFRRVS